MNTSSEDAAAPRPLSSQERSKRKINSIFSIFSAVFIYGFLATAFFLRFFHESTKENDNLASAIEINDQPYQNQSFLVKSPVEAKDEQANDPASIDWTDSIFRREGWDNDPIVIESHKLLFFTVPKNACSTFKKLFRRMMGKENWLHGSPHNPEKNGLRYLGEYPKSEQEKFMTSSEWTRAIFVRDPLERALSAYMDKALHTGPGAWQPAVQGAHLKRHCCKAVKSKNPACRKHPLSPYETHLTTENFPFESFVKLFMKQCKDHHWRPQYQRMHSENWKWINFVGHFDNKQNDTRRLLELIGAYEDFGASGWGEKTTEDGTTKTLAIFEKNLANHKTGSGDKMDQHYSSMTERFVLQYYRRDYSSTLFNLTKPEAYSDKLFGRTLKNQTQDRKKRANFTPEMIDTMTRQRQG